MTRQRIVGMHANAHLKAERSHDRKVFGCSFGCATFSVFHHLPFFQSIICDNKGGGRVDVSPPAPNGARPDDAFGGRVKRGRILGGC